MERPRFTCGCVLQHQRLSARRKDKLCVFGTDDNDLRIVGYGRHLHHVRAAAHQPRPRNTETIWRGRPVNVHHQYDRVLYYARELRYRDQEHGSA